MGQDMTLSKPKATTAALAAAEAEAAIEPVDSTAFDRLADDQNAEPPSLSVHIIYFNCRCVSTIARNRKLPMPFSIAGNRTMPMPFNIEGIRTRGRRRNCDAERL